MATDRPSDAAELRAYEALFADMRKAAALPLAGRPDVVADAEVRAERRRADQACRRAEELQRHIDGALPYLREEVEPGDAGHLAAARRAALTVLETGQPDLAERLAEICQTAASNEAGPQAPTTPTAPPQPLV